MYHANDIENFWKKVSKTNNCWLWTGATSKAKRRSPYGTMQITIKGEDGYIWRRSEYVHRFSFQLHNVVQISANFSVDHLCKNTLCVNPDHLEMVLPIDNLYRGYPNHMGPFKATHCIRGHAWTESSTRWYTRKKSGKSWRLCIECQRVRDKDTYSRNKG